jgi:hypothetical protein
MGHSVPITLLYPASWNAAVICTTSSASRSLDLAVLHADRNARPAFRSRSADSAATVSGLAAWS